MVHFWSFVFQEISIRNEKETRIPLLPMNECFSSADALIEEFRKSTIRSNNLQKKHRKHQIRKDLCIRTFRKWITICIRKKSSCYWTLCPASSGVFLAWLLAFHVACQSRRLVWVKHLKKKYGIMSSGGSRPPPLFFDQNEARRSGSATDEGAVNWIAPFCHILARLTLTSQTAACIAYKNRK